MMGFCKSLIPYYEWLPLYQLPKNIEDGIDALCTDSGLEIEQNCSMEKVIDAQKKFAEIIAANVNKIFYSIAAFIDGETRESYIGKRTEYLSDVAGGWKEEDKQKIYALFPDSSEGMERYLLSSSMPAAQFFSEPLMMRTKEAAKRKASKEYGEKEEEGQGDTSMPYSPIFLENFIQPNDLLSNQLWKNKIPLGKWTQLTTIPTKKINYGILVKLDIYEDAANSDDVSIDIPLDIKKRPVHDAVCSIADAGYTEFWTLDVLRALEQNPKARLTDKKYMEIKEAMDMCYSRRVFILSSSNVEAWHKLEENMEINILPESDKEEDVLPYGKGSLIAFEENGIAQGRGIHYKLLSTPLLLRYAKAKKQIATTPMRMLNISTHKKGRLNRNMNMNSIVSFLAREIDTMEKNQKYSRSILWDRLYEMGGLEENSYRQEKERTRKKVIKALDDMKNLGRFHSYLQRLKKEGRAWKLHSIVICLTKKELDECRKLFNQKGYKYLLEGIEYAS